MFNFTDPKSIISVLGHFSVQYSNSTLSKETLKGGFQCSLSVTVHKKFLPHQLNLNFAHLQRHDDTEKYELSNISKPLKHADMWLLSLLQLIYRKAMMY
jgi:hypothetical protein